MKDLISVDDYKIYAGISSTDNDEKFELVAKNISSLVKTYCARNFIDNYDISTSSFTDITEYFNGGSDVYYTSEFPLVSITSVSYSDDGGQTYTALTDYTDYILDKQNDRIMLSGAENIVFPNYFKIVYKGGYSETPYDLRLACLDLMDYYIKRESTKAKSSASVSLEYITTSDFPSHIKRVLDLYRIIR